MEVIKSGRTGPTLALAAPATVRRAPGVVDDGRRAVARGAPRRAAVRTADGVRPDLADVFARDYPLVVGVATRVLGSREHAEDVAQDVFLSFNRTNVPADQARGWLSVAAAHTALNHLRSRRRRTRREQTVAAGTDPVVPDVSEVVVTGEDRRRVRAALARLPRKQATALVLRHSGLSYAEVASALNLSPASVGTTVRRAEAALREELNRDATPQ